MTNRSNLFSRLFLATMLALGFAVVWGPVGSWLAYAAHASRAPRDQEILFLGADGTPVRSSRPWQAGPPVRWEGEFRQVFLPAGLRVPPWPDVSWGQRLRVFDDHDRLTTLWYLVTDGRARGSAYLVGYDQATKTRIGFLGTAGFREGALPPGERFPFSGVGDALLTRVHDSCLDRSGYMVFMGMLPLTGIRSGVPQWLVYVHGDDHKVYQVDLNTRTVCVALEDPGLRSVALLRASSRTGDGGLRLVARTDREVLVLNDRNEVLQRSLIPEDIRGQDFHWAKTPPGHGFFYTQQTPDAHARPWQFRFYWVGADGQVARQEEALVPDHDPGLDQRALSGVFLPSAVLIDGCVVVIQPLQLLEGGHADSYVEGLGKSLAEYRPALVIVHLLGLVLAGLCYRRQIRYAASGVERLVWPLFVFLFGLPGWVGYLTCRSWPVRQRCPACGATVPQDRVDCAACQAEFPLPALKGTEVYAA